MTEPPLSFPRRRDRRGRGLRGPALPIDAPVRRTRAEAFDDLVLDAIEHLQPRWSTELSSVEFAVEDVPAVEHTSPDDVIHLPNVVEDASVPLSRVIPGRVGADGRALPPRIVFYRRPLEVRGATAEDLRALVHDVVVEQVASLLGRDPDDIDPPTA